MDAGNKLQDLSQYPIDRIGKAYCMMNCFEWDTEIFGKPPKGWNKMDSRTKYENRRFRECFKLIDAALTEREKSMYWWTIELKRSYNDWKKWYDKEEGCTGEGLV